MSCNEVTLSVRKNRKKVFRFSLTDAAGERVDLSGSLITFIAVWAGGSFVKTTADDGFEHDLDEGNKSIVVLTLTPSETDAFPPVPIRYEVFRGQGDDKEFLAEGPLSAQESLNA